MAIKANLIIDQGTDYSTTINVTDDFDETIDLSGYSGVAQMRKHYTSVSYYSFDVATNAQGEVILSMSANTTNNIPAGRYVYDCELTDSFGKKSRLVEGIATITPQVTR